MQRRVLQQNELRCTKHLAVEAFGRVSNLMDKIDAGGFEQSWNNEKVCECAKEVRLGFLRKVYGILSVQLIATAIVCILALTVQRGTPASSKWNILALGSFLAGRTRSLLTCALIRHPGTRPFRVGLTRR